MAKEDHFYDSEVAHLAFDLGLHNLDRLRSDLDELRSRSSGLLAAVSVATAFLAGFALSERSEPLGAPAYVGFAAPVLAALLLTNILRPRSGWTFGFKSHEIVKVYYLGDYEGSPGPHTMEETHVRLAQAIGDWTDQINSQMKSMYRQFTLAAGAVGATLLAWVSDLLNLAR